MIKDYRIYWIKLKFDSISYPLNDKSLIEPDINFEIKKIIPAIPKIGFNSMKDMIIVRMLKKIAY